MLYVLTAFVLICLYPYFSFGLGMLWSDVKYVLETIITGIVQSLCQIILYIRLRRHDGK